MRHLTLALLSSAVFFGGCQQNTADNEGAVEQVSKVKDDEPRRTPDLKVEFEKYQLENGLTVILHVDRSDPTAAIDLAAHVGSGREVPGRTGFAHLFEHLLFQSSENLGFGGLDRLNERVGGPGTNGWTGNDETHYFQRAPSDALEKMIWAEAEKIGFFINTVTEGSFEKEKLVVKNEKRQAVDNNPYGHNSYVIGKALYPEDHPYNWQVIGSLKDLEAATLQDVKDFYKRWYVPNNVSITIAGDIDVEQTKVWVEKYFGEIPRGEDVKKRKPRPAVLESVKSLYHEDSFATLPSLTMTWPAVELYHPDSYALKVLADYLSRGKEAPLYQALIENDDRSSYVYTTSSQQEIAGEFTLSVDGNSGEDLDNILPLVMSGLKDFEDKGIEESDVQRIKSKREVEFYGELNRAIDKAILLATYNMYSGDPGFIQKDLEGLLSVTPEDVMRVYQKYIKDKPYVVTSFVPKGEPELALEGAAKATVEEENIETAVSTFSSFDPSLLDYERTPSSFDRSVEPPFGKPYKLSEPEIWQSELSNGIKVYGIESGETPMVELSLSIDAGRNRGSAEKPAIASLTASMMMTGTATKSASDLEKSLNELGASVSFGASDDGVTVSVKTIARNLAATVKILEDVLLNPSFENSELDLLKASYINAIESSKGSADAIANEVMASLLYPAGSPLHYAGYGTPEAVNSVSIEDIKAFHAEFYRPENAIITLVGQVDNKTVTKAFDGLSQHWDGKKLGAPINAKMNSIPSSKLYFYDIPNAKQSALYIAKPSVPASHPDYRQLRIVNEFFGGSYIGQLNGVLRLEKGYTYGARSSFEGKKGSGLFVIQTSVQSNATGDSVGIIKSMLESLDESISEDELTRLQKAIPRRQALATEAPFQKLEMLNSVAHFGYPSDYISRQSEAFSNLSIKDVKKLVRKYFQDGKFHWVVVGDAATQFEALSELGFDEVVLLERK